MEIPALNASIFQNKMRRNVKRYNIINKIQLRNKNTLSVTKLQLYSINGSAMQLNEIKCRERKKSAKLRTLLELHVEPFNLVIKTGKWTDKSMEGNMTKQ